MSRFVATALLTLAVAPSTGFAQGGMSGIPATPWPFQEWSVKIETTGDQSVSGSLLIASVPVECELGLYQIRPEKIKAVRFTKPGEKPTMRNLRGGPPGGPGGPGAIAPGFHEGAVSTTTGGEIVGSVYVANWRVRTDLGEVTLDPSKLKSVTFAGKGDPPAEAK